MTNGRTTEDADAYEAQTDELKPGTALLHGQYTIESFLNSGGFGITYLARDSLDRIVVIKECFPSSFCRRTDTIVRARSRAHQKEFRSIVKLFVQEARNLSKLDHPHIVGVHQVFEDNETAYMALDFVDGDDLLDVIESDPETFSATEIRGLLTKLLDAVGFIHDQNILHRDISPDNILLDSLGNPVLIDFGAAREEATRASRVLSTLLVVKDGYSPQEFYIQGSAQNASSDLYALGATFYHLITGGPPPNSQTRLAAIAADQMDPYKSLVRNVTGYDPYFLGAIDKALNVFPKDRFQTAHEWSDMINATKRRAAARAEAQMKKTMEISVGDLVAMTNRDILDGDAAPEPELPGQVQPTMPEQVAASAAPRTSQDARVPSQRPVSAPRVSVPNALRAQSQQTQSAERPVSQPRRISELIPDEPVVAEPRAPRGLRRRLMMGASIAAVIVAGVGIAVVQLGHALAPGVKSAAVLENSIDTSALSAVPQEDPGIATRATPLDADGALPTLPVAQDPARAAQPAALPGVQAEAQSTQAAPQDDASAPGSNGLTIPTVLTGWFVDLPFTTEDAATATIATLSPGAASWMRPGQTVLAVNGVEVSSVSDIRNFITTNVTPGNSGSVNMRFRVSEGGNTFEETALLPVVWEVSLLNGTQFHIRQEPEGWRTTVSAVSGFAGDNLERGDVLLTYIPTEEQIIGKTNLAEILRREIEKGREAFDFAITRQGEMRVASIQNGSVTATD